MKKIAIVGLPNSGKTTLFNGITGKDERVGNWYGVTTKPSFGDVKVNGIIYRIYDLPGSYYQDNYTLEQRENLTFLRQFDGLILVCESVNFIKGIELLKRLKTLKINIILVFNMYNELLNRKGKITFEKLEEITCLKVLNCQLNSNKGIRLVKDNLCEFLFQTGEKSDFSVEKVVKMCFSPPKITETNLDKWVLNGFISLPLFLISFVLVLYFAFGRFGFGNALEILISKVFEIAVNQPIEGLMNLFKVGFFIKALVIDGILKSFKEILVFLPQLAIINLYLTLLEESGILSRIAFLLHNFFSLQGLTGRSAFMFLSSFGCTLSGVFCSSGLESECVKKRGICSLPFIPCSAKTAAVFYLLKTIGTKFSFLFVALIFLCSLIFGFVVGVINFKLFYNEKPKDLIIEFPPYRLPKAKLLFKSLQKFAKSFIIKIGSAIFTISCFLWLLSSLSVNLKLLESGTENCILSVISKKISFLFLPCGIDNWKLVTCLISGLFAKEGVIATLSILGAEGLTIKSTVCFMVFYILYPPCITAMWGILKEEGWLFALSVFVFYFYLGYMASCLINGKLLIFIVNFVAIILLYCIMIKKNKFSGSKNGKVYFRKRC